MKPKRYNDTQQALSDAYDQVSYAQQVLACQRPDNEASISNRLLKISNELIELIRLAKNTP